MQVIIRRPANRKRVAIMLALADNFAARGSEINGADQECHALIRPLTNNRIR